MPLSISHRMTRGALAATAASAMLVTLLSVPASADTIAGSETPDNPIFSSLSTIPDVEGPILEDESTHMFSSMLRARVPFDVADFGYVEEEYFISGTSNVYDEIDGSIAVVASDVPYVNRILVRRPAEAADSSGVIDVEITNASNGFAGEDMWRRLGEHHLAAGDTYIGIVSKPSQINALKTYDADRYSSVGWNEEGQAWDIIAQMGALLKSDDAGLILGGQTPTTVLLTGQSQSGGYLGTYTNKFAGLVEQANGQSVYDGYLNVVGLTGRSILQGGRPTPAADPELSVPNILIDSELILDRRGERVLPSKQRVWQVPGTPHTDLLSTVIPSDEEIYKSGLTPNLDVHNPAFLAKLSLYPLEPTIFAAFDALVKWDQEGIPAAPSVWQDTSATGALLRDEAGNVTGGVRYGLIDQPLGQYLGTDGPGFTPHGVMNLMTLEQFEAKYDTRSDYLALMSDIDAAQIEAGYLTNEGAEYFVDVANQMMDRIGVPKLDVIFDVAAECKGHKNKLTVSAENGEDVRISVSIDTDYGSATLSNLKSGKEKSKKFTTGLSTLPAGNVSVTATAVIDGRTVTMTEQIEYASQNCR